MEASFPKELATDFLHTGTRDQVLSVWRRHHSLPFLGSAFNGRRGKRVDKAHTVLTGLGLEVTRHCHHPLTAPCHLVRPSFTWEMWALGGHLPARCNDMMGQRISVHVGRQLDISAPNTPDLDKRSNVHENWAVETRDCANIQPCVECSAHERSRVSSMRLGVWAGGEWQCRWLWNNVWDICRDKHTCVYSCVCVCVQFFDEYKIVQTLMIRS